MVDRFQDAVRSPAKSQSHGSSQAVGTPMLSSSTSASQAARNEALTRELQQLKRINGVIHKVNEMILKSQADVHQLNKTTVSTQHLLNYWVKVLSQANYNHNFIQEIDNQAAIDADNGIDNSEKTSEEIADGLRKKTRKEKELQQILQSLESENAEMEQQVEIREKREKELLEQKLAQDANRKRQFGLVRKPPQKRQAR